ncbi:MAG: imidazolonepropionase [Anaerolineae bacterium]|nr:imidazolonepropionase [Anaerolineae bacterium]MCB9108770.1 imidazolonepropionase [Anaerolineales bacterium]
MTKIDLLIYNATQVATCAGPDGPKRGKAMADVDLIKDGAVAVADGQIVAVGPTAELRAAYTAEQMIDAAGKVVCPGFVEPHTHVVFAGDRVDEFELRVKGTSYQEIMAAGGGIVSTTTAVRQASVEQLVAETRPRLDAMLALGTTTVEIKTGYGLDTASEMKLLRAIEVLAGQHTIDIVPTFLGAHAIPSEYQGRADAYTDLVIDEMLPAAAAWYQASFFAARHIPLFNDVFCEQNAFNLDQSRRVLAAGLALGLPVKIHADEFTALGGVSLAVELGAVSVDHLDVTTPAERAVLAASETVGVVLPAVNFNLGSLHFADARALIDDGAALALSTDINPGSAPCPSLPLVMAIACRYQKLLPAEALNAVTRNAAYAIGLGNEVGSLEPDKQADILIVDAPDYRHLAYQFGGNLVETVIKRGRVVGEGRVVERV